MFARHAELAHATLQMGQYRVVADREYLRNFPSGLSFQRPLQDFQFASRQPDQSTVLSLADGRGDSESGRLCERGQQRKRSEHSDEPWPVRWQGVVAVEAKQEVFALRQMRRDGNACAQPERRLEVPKVARAFANVQGLVIAERQAQALQTFQNRIAADVRHVLGGLGVCHSHVPDALVRTTWASAWAVDRYRCGDDSEVVVRSERRQQLFERHLVH